jgi:hypothetical protein
MTSPRRLPGFLIMRLVVMCVAAGTVANSAANWVAFRANADAAQQICDLVVNTHVDRVKRLGATLDYLATTAGREHTALSDYIRRASLPQLRAEVAKERESLPPTCVAGRHLPKIPAA